MNDDKDLDDSFDSTSASSNLLGSGLKKKTTPDIPFCGCLSIQYYQPYFDVDTDDITTRIWNSVIYCRREQNFLVLVQDHPDLYGPFWVTTSNVSTNVNLINMPLVLMFYRLQPPWCFLLQSRLIWAVGCILIWKNLNGNVTRRTVIIHMILKIVTKFFIFIVIIYYI